MRAQPRATHYPETVKVVIQIPCLNEEATLPLVLSTIPTPSTASTRSTSSIIDDGSTDRTAEVAREHGVTHIVSHARTMGLARSFQDGIDYALAHGADIVVNTDGDNQYPQERIGDLVAPILAGRADIVIGDRQTQTIAHFSVFKKSMQRFGSLVVNRAAGTKLPDAASGFRAYSRYSLYRLNIVTQFSYCMETIIQAGNKRLAIESVPIPTNPKTRESRLFKNVFEHMLKSGAGDSALVHHVQTMERLPSARVASSASRGWFPLCASRFCGCSETTAITFSRSSWVGHSSPAPFCA